MVPQTTAEIPREVSFRRGLRRATAIVLLYAAIFVVDRVLGIRAEHALTAAGPPFEMGGRPAIYSWWLGIGFLFFVLSVFMAVAALGVAAYSVEEAVRTRLTGTRWQLARDHLMVAIAVLLGIGVMYLWPTPWQNARRQGLAAVTQRLSPLVSAIERFEHEHGRPPADLSDLVPGYLSALPSHPARGCRQLQYKRFGADSPRGWPPWELRMECPHSLFDLDQLFYWPGSRYVPNMYNDRVGAWAYNWD